MNRDLTMGLMLIKIVLYTIVVASCSSTGEQQQTELNNLNDTDFANFEEDANLATENGLGEFENNNFANISLDEGNLSSADEFEASTPSEVEAINSNPTDDFGVEENIESLPSFDASTENGFVFNENPNGGEVTSDILPVETAPVGMDVEPSENNTFFDQSQSDFTEETISNTNSGSQELEESIIANQQPPQEVGDELVPVPENDILPILFNLRWVGYEYLRDEKQLKVDILTTGRPEFRMFFERNQLGQSELVVRFLQTDIRKKIKWDIDASEFRSPVAYIRMRKDSELGFADVVLTMRTFVKPRFFAKDSNITLSFAIPERYFGRQEVAENDPVGQARTLSEVDLLLDVEQGSELPSIDQQQARTQQSNEVVVPTSDQQDFEEFNEGIQEGNTGFEIDDGGFPESFDSVQHNPWQEDEDLLRSMFRNQDIQIETFYIGAVGQDDLDVGAAGNAGVAEELPENFVFEAEPVNNAVVGDTVQAVEEDIEQGNEQFDDFVGGTNEPINEAVIDSSPAENSNFAGNLEAEGSEPLEQQNAVFNSNLSNAETLPFSTDVPELSVDDDFEKLTNQETDLIGREGNEGSSEEVYEGKLVYLDFTEAPLSLVLKAFANETRNNFVFSKEIGSIPVTVSFQGVPWDQALKAILETFSLGMVRVGENIVRVDSLDKLTDYLSKLQKAQVFETRRIPTKVLVMRLNNAKATEVLTQVNPLLEQAKADDPRIKASADERTNSVVMEAPEYVLSKVKNIITRLDLETPQVEITSRIVEVQKSNNDQFGASIINQALANFDPGRGLGFGSLNFPNNIISRFSVDAASPDSVGKFRARFGSINKFVDLDLILSLEENRGTTNVLQRNRVLVLDNEQATILAGNSRFFDTGAGAIIAPPGGEGQVAAAGNGLTEITFNLQLNVTPQVTADGAVIMDLEITSDTPADTAGSSAVDGKSTRELKTKMIRNSGDTGVIGGIYDTIRSKRYTGLPFLSRIPIIGALFRSTVVDESQTELLIMVTPNIVSRQPMGNFGNDSLPSDSITNFSNANAAIFDQTNEGFGNSDFGNQGNLTTTFDDSGFNNTSNSLNAFEDFESDNNFNLEDGAGGNFDAVNNSSNAFGTLNAAPLNEASEGDAALNGGNVSDESNINDLEGNDVLPEENVELDNLGNLPEEDL